MASLRMKTFQVKVFCSSSLLEVEPDVFREISALTEVTAITSVMQRAGISAAGVVYVVCEGQERWLYGVLLVDGQVLCEFVV
jgi:hypothetical protein